jgi:hypothetical protein
MKINGAPNNHSRLEDALATMVPTQASFLERLAESDRAQVETERRRLERDAKTEQRLLDCDAETERQRLDREAESEQRRLVMVEAETERRRQRAELGRVHLELQREQLSLKRETDERFLRIETQIAEIIRVLNEHTPRLG